MYLIDIIVYGVYFGQLNDGMINANSNAYFSPTGTDIGNVWGNFILL